MSLERGLKQRKASIEKCISWVNEYGAASAFEHVMKLDLISFQTSLSLNDTSSGHTSYRPPMVGIFAVGNVKRGETLLTIPDQCVLSENNEYLRELSGLVVDKAMANYHETLARTSSDQYSVWDPLYKTHGRVLCTEELRVMLLLTLLLFAKRRKPIRNVKSQLNEASRHWNYYMDTLPGDYSSLIFHWSEREIKNLERTACHALVCRLRQEVTKNWEDSFRAVLVEFLQKEDPSQDIDYDLLFSSYMDAVCGVYSRMHGLDATPSALFQTSSRCVCPLIDLTNGDREDSPRINAHLLQYPGSHVALQASRDIALGEELIFSYGTISNQIFISKFGFLPLNKQGYPQMEDLDVVYLLPPPEIVMEESDPKWNALTNARDGTCLARHHLVEDHSNASCVLGSPFALRGNKFDIAKVRTTETWLPPYMENFHMYAMTFLTEEEDLYAPRENIEPYIEPWEPGALIIHMIDSRLQAFSQPTMSSEKALMQTQEGNFRTGTLYRILEREILQMWRHAIAMHYAVYGERNVRGDVVKPLATEDLVCETCQASLAGPLKFCVRCKRVCYCGQLCQKEDWKAWHKHNCQPVTRET